MHETDEGQTDAQECQDRGFRHTAAALSVDASPWLAGTLVGLELHREVQNSVLPPEHQLKKLQLADDVNYTDSVDG